MVNSKCTTTALGMETVFYGFETRIIMNKKKILQTLELAETELKSCYRKLGITESNVLKDVIEAQGLVKNCSIPDVVGQSEQLKAFLTWLEKEGYNLDFEWDESTIEDFIKSL